ncbi:MAG: type III-B CRISPR-associated protein Cas10/Cmr2 [Cyanobacteriota bacterium]|nr:type III-B CRISPR-associated protein Cas10/Cmr2 [Cyanobacteriota bacterium]
MTYTAVTFAPVQSFIQASRKLRDLYGSSLLLSHLARAIADDAKARDLEVISPASIDSSRGVPNVVVIQGDYRKGHAREALLASWKGVLEACRQWVERALPDTQFVGQSSWRACSLHSWELFHGQGSSIAEAREALAVNKQQRDWSVPNWTGESSTLSSAEAVVWPGMGAVQDPRLVPSGIVQDKCRTFLGELRAHRLLGEAFAGLNEELSIIELVKRLVTYPDITAQAFCADTDQEANPKALMPSRFRDLSMIAKENQAEVAKKPESIVWFMADGDGIGDHLQSLALKKGEKEALQSFSQAMRTWAAGLYERVPAVMENQAMVVYAGGDDLFGALHETEPGANDLTTDHLWRWLRQFPEIWKGCKQEQLTVSMGLVWADAKVPQREALQHAREAEASAKARGKNRFALRLLYASGNHLEWTCPWDWLDRILTHYTDREGRTLNASRDGRPPSWRHLAEDLQWLHSRQAIAAERTVAGTRAGGPPAAPSVSEALFEAYFPGWRPPRPPEEGIGRNLDHWLLDLGRVMAGLEKHRPRAARGAER